MKAINTPLIITSIRSRKDGSLGFGAETPELTSEEKVAFMELQGVNLEAVFSLVDQEESSIIQVQQNLDLKSDSERQRSAFYRLFCSILEKQGKNLDDHKHLFPAFYHKRMEKNINQILLEVDEYKDNQGGV